MLPEYQRVLELTRGNVVESIHLGAIAVVDVYGRLVAWYGNPDVVTFMRSSAKPFQALPLIEHKGDEVFVLTDEEIAIICASHSGTDEHVILVQSLQSKIGIREAELLCGTHPPYHEPTAIALRDRKEEPTPNRHNCSGKHSGMLFFIELLKQNNPGVSGGSLNDLPYIDPNHPIQQEILTTFAAMCQLPPERVEVGIDGCSAPNFAVPLRNAAFAFARLCDPDVGKVFPGDRAKACRKITKAMMNCPFMVAGPGRFDTCLMESAKGKIVSKGGAEGYQGIGLMPGALGKGTPAMGIALKISDGDDRKCVRSAVTLEVLRQLGALTPSVQQAMKKFGPSFPIYNWRKIVVGEAKPVFQLKFSGLT